MRWFQRQIFRSMVMAVAVVSAASNTFALDLDALKAGVVKITTKTGQVGTGFIVRVESEMLYIITAAHVIAGDPQPTIDFFSKDRVAGGQAAVTGSVLPGAQVNDDLRGVAVVIVRGKAQGPAGLSGLAFASSAQLVSGGEQALVIGHPGGGGDWALVKRDISNRVVHDITLDPGVASRFSGGPILVDGKVVGMVMTNRGEFGLGITHKNLLNYLDGIGIEPQATDGRALGGFVIKPEEPSRLPNNHRLNRGPGGFIVEEPPQSSSKALPSSMTGKDGTPMVLVPAGEFTMGSRGDDTKARDNERPAHQVYLDAYYIDQYEVTVKPYQRFIEENNRTAPKHWEQMDMRRDAQKPVVGIDWYDAYAYCRWARKRLPTEAEWEKAARGTDKRTYPWGEFTPNSSTANFGKGSLDVKNVYAERLKDVGSYEGGKSPYGAYDMAGNAEEWVQDWYGEDYYQSSPRENPSGPRDGKRKVLRGGSWAIWDGDVRGYLSSTKRSHGTPSWRDYFGFRCAQDAP